VENFRPHIVQGRSALHLAAFNGEREEVERLVTSGAEIEATDKEGWAPQISACAFQNVKDWNMLSPNLVEECRHALAAGKNEPAEPESTLNNLGTSWKYLEAA